MKCRISRYLVATRNWWR